MLHPTEKEERLYLDEIEKELKEELVELDEKLQEYQEKILGLKQYMYENQAQLDNVEKAMSRISVLEEALFGEDVLKQKKRVTKLIDSPYFGRIDFCHDDKEEVFYIGVYGFSRGGGLHNLIYDWRAPVSSVFYDFEIGPAHYLAPMGEVDGELRLKRQYKIQRGIMDYMIESSLNIGDEVLQKELSHSSDEKMKNIVATIQKEQNQIIRNETAKVMIIQGAAGSGKTSIALHRIAFLLYRQRGVLNSQNILIISPNKVFADYISSVLPELGEENIAEIEFDELAREYMGKKYKYQTFAQQVESLIENEDPAARERIRLKATNQFVEQLQSFLEEAQERYFAPEDLSVEDVFASKESIEKEYHYYKNLSIKVRLRKIADRILHKYRAENEKKLDPKAAKKVRDTVQHMFLLPDAMALYQAFYESIGQPQAFCMAGKKTLEYADLYPFLYTKLFFEGVDRGYEKVKHLLVDEMQDYTPIQYAVLAKLFSCRMTILGDSFQSVNPYSSSSIEKIEPYFEGCQTIELCKSYRSTLEISEFARKILNNKKLVSIERHGPQPTVSECADSEEELARVRQLMEEFRNSSFGSMGIICKSQSQAGELFEKLQQAGEEVTLLDFESTSFSQGIVVTSVHMSKGLEFDQVILPGVSQQNYRTQMEQSLLYIACTRAMHRLDVTCSGKKSDFLQ